MSYDPIGCLVKAQTLKAVLISDGTQDVWVPKSCIDEDDLDGIELNEFNELNIATWFAEKMGLL